MKIIGYETNTKNAKCECEIKVDQIILSQLNNQTDLFYYNFSNNDISSIMVTMKCVYTLFTKEGIYTNIASYIFIFFNIVFIISGIWFYKFGFNFLDDYIKEIINIKEEDNKNNKDINKNETIIDNNEKNNINKIKKKKKNKKRKKTKKSRKNKKK